MSRLNLNNLSEFDDVSSFKKTKKKKNDFDKKHIKNSGKRNNLKEVSFIEDWDEM